MNTYKETEFKDTEIGKIPHDWEVKELGELCKFQEGYVNPSQTNPNFFGDEIKWLRVNDLNDTFIYDTSRKLSKEGFKSAGKSAKLFEPESIAISKSGTIGKLGVLKDFMCGNRAIININPIDKNQTKYILNFLKLIREELKSKAVGSVQKNLYVSILEKVNIPLPPTIEEQKSIAKILSDLDSKIEMNKHINQTLEEMGKTLFKRWFVDFEFPNENGEEYKSNGGEMVFCEELGKEIPKGWRAGRLGELVKIQSGYAFKSKDFVKYSKSRLIKIKNISGGIVNLTDSGFIDDNSIQNLDSKFIIKEKDILIAMTGAEIGKIGVVQKSNYKLLLNQRVGMFKQIFDYGLLYSYIVFNSNEYLKKIRDKAIGSAQPNISSTEIENISLLISNKNTLIEFEKIYSNFFNNYIDNLNEIQYLQNTRDVLLPKLMRGEIRVKNE
ncbi:MAG: restriction endonuclease subunit S [Candidatus Nanoarchaeia archaeon]